MVMHLAGPVLRRAAPKIALPRNGFVWLLGLSFAFSLQAADVADVRQQFINGQYEECYRNCKEAIAEQEYGEEWRLLGIQALLEMGRYTNALELLTASLGRYSSSVQMRLLGYEVLLRNGDTERAPLLLQEINVLAGGRAWAYRGPSDLVALGRTALLLGAEQRKVLEQLFDKAKKADPECREAYLASGDLALDKNDSDLASKIFTEGLKKFPDDPDLNAGLR